LSIPAYATNNVSIEWVIYSGCTNIDDNDVNDWTDAGTYKLCNDSDANGANDVSVDTVLVFEGGDAEGNWTCWFGDDEVTSSGIAGWIFAALDTHSEDTCGVTKIEIGGDSIAGYCNGSSIIISGSAADDGTFVHEVGHCADLDDLSGVDNEDRIMYETTAGSEEEVITGCPTNGNEKDAYEDLGSL